MKTVKPTIQKKTAEINFAVFILKGMLWNPMPVGRFEKCKPIFVIHIYLHGILKILNRFRLSTPDNRQNLGRMFQYEC